MPVGNNQFGSAPKNGPFLKSQPVFLVRQRHGLGWAQSLLLLMMMAVIVMKYIEFMRRRRKKKKDGVAFVRNRSVVLDGWMAGVYCLANYMINDRLEMYNPPSAEPSHGKRPKVEIICNKLVEEFLRAFFFSITAFSLPGWGSRGIQTCSKS